MGNGGARPVRFMSFNIRFDTEQDEPGGNRWRDRAKSVVETVQRFDPDVVGFQEALASQLRDLTESLDDYRGVGKPRDVGETAEYVPLFFRASRFELEDHGDFWMSPTPEVEGSRGWDTDVPRHCTWARLGDTTNGLTFAVFNTHLDVWGTLARLEAARLIVTRTSVAPVLPSVVMGDFNAEENSEPLKILRGAGFRDTYRDLHPDADDVQTLHHYEAFSGGRKIDYVMCDRHWRVEDAEIVREPAAGRLPSDHFPIGADLVPIVSVA